MKVVVVVVSDGVHAGTREDRSGPAAVEALAAAGFPGASIAVVADEREEIGALLRSLAADGVALAVTSGGTGFGPRDVTPEATRDVLEREAPGLAEGVRAASPPPLGLLSRGVAGVVGGTLVVNLPGSTGGVREGIAVVAPALGHALDLLAGADTPHPRPPG